MAERRRHTSGASVVGFPLDVPHLADTSAWSKARNHDALAALFDDAARGGLIATCDLVALELLRSARNHQRFERQNELLTNLPACPLGTAQFARAREMQASLAASGHHRGVKHSDLLIAAAGEAAGLPILHYDHDYDLIASVTKQPIRWLSARGSLP
jgi:predicted nucleic acid-binding protein